MLYHLADRRMPEGLEGLSDLALDLRWTGSESTDRIWELLDPEAWERTNNPYMILQNVSRERLEEAAKDDRLREELARWLDKRRKYLEDPGWFGQRYADSDLKCAAYFSMEFGLSEALPIYSGGLGILAGDHLKTASDLGVPLIGVGLLYQQGYFRQLLDASRWQLEAFPYNDPTSLPVVPVYNADGSWLRIKLELPGRKLLVRVWQAYVGKVRLYLLDTNDPLNTPWDRGITATLYAGAQERRLIQEIVLGVGGWRVLEELGIDPQVCHLNEGHAAFAVLQRARSFMEKHGGTFFEALWATRAGNVFTTHTAVAAGFDRFSGPLVQQYAHHFAERVGITVDELLGLGRVNPADPNEPFTMAYLAIHGCSHTNAVSELHGRVSQGMFNVLYPGWPQRETPVSYVTNGVHVPSWDSRSAHDLWQRVCGDHYFIGGPHETRSSLEQISDQELWEFRADARRSLVEYARRRMTRQVQEHGMPASIIQIAKHVLDPNALTLGFARRFAGYKRPTLMLHDAERLARILCDPERPAQLLIAGKAHPEDVESKKLVQQMAMFAQRPDVYQRVVFLEDYDIALAQQLAGGIDVWINNPLRPWEACGTSGMKMLVNGGLNLSELDGWWAEAYTPEVGWALGDGIERSGPEWDAREANQLYELLEQQIIPTFYDRDAEGIPANWCRMVRNSMCQLTDRFSSARMVAEYVEKSYLCSASAYQRRAAEGPRVAQQMIAWHQALSENWKGVRFGDVRVSGEDGQWHFEALVYLGDVTPADVRVELYAEPEDGGYPAPVPMERDGEVIGATNAYRYRASVPASRPAEHYTSRIVAHHPEAFVPQEAAHICWQR